MSHNTKRVMAFVAPVIGVALAALIMLPLLDRTISPVTSGVMIGAAGAICLPTNSITGIGSQPWVFVSAPTCRCARSSSGITAETCRPAG